MHEKLIKPFLFDLDLFFFYNLDMQHNTNHRHAGFFRTDHDPPTINVKAGRTD